MKEYGTVETEHMGICKDCKETKTVRLFLTEFINGKAHLL